MTTHTFNTKNSVLVAIDVAKHAHVALIEYPQGSRKRLRFKSTQEDFNYLINLLKSSQLHIIVAFEATADYHRTLADHLQLAGFQCYFVSSIAVARTRDALFNSWDKNDPKDAQVILHLIKTGVLQSAKHVSITALSITI